MKKEIIIITIIIIGIVIANIITESYVNNFFNQVSENLLAIEEKILSNNLDAENLKNDIKNVEDDWVDRYNYIACYIEHDELEKIRNEIISASANIKTENYDKSVESIERCRFLLEHLEEKDSVKIINIF